jgi:hypothetical protein
MMVKCISNNPIPQEILFLMLHEVVILWEMLLVEIKDMLIFKNVILLEKYSQTIVVELLGLMLPIRRVKYIS